MSVRTYPPGIFVPKAAQNLPQDTTANLYTVSGGSVLVTGMLGIVTTACGSTATTLSLGVSAGSATTAIATATAVTSSPIGTWLVPEGSSGGPTALKVGGVVFMNAPPYIVNPFLVSAGNITWTTSANDTGQVQWYLWYVPLDFDATVT
jgi:hypothetical protein